MAKAKKPLDPAHVIRQRMEARGVTKYRLAELTGIPRQTIGPFIEGQRNITSEYFVRILDALDLAITPKEDR